MNNFKKFAIGTSLVYNVGAVGMFGKLSHDFSKEMADKYASVKARTMKSSAFYIGYYTATMVLTMPFFAIPSAVWPVVLIHMYKNRQN